MAIDLLCLTMPQVQARLGGTAYLVRIYPGDSGGLLLEDSLYCIRQRWCGAKEQWELVFTPFSHGIN